MELQNKTLLQCTILILTHIFTPQQHTFHKTCKKSRLIFGHTGRGVVWRSHKNDVGTDAVREDTGGRLDVVEVDVAVLGDEVEDVVLGRRLHGDWKVVRREGDVDGFLGEGLVAGARLADLDHVQLAARGRAHGKAEDGRVLLL